MDQTQNDSFGSLLNDQGGNMQTGGNVGGFNNVGIGGQQTLPPMPISTRGPIVLNNGGEKKSKKWVVIILILLLVVLAILGIIFLAQKSHDDAKKAEFVEKWDSYYRLVVSGPDGDDEQNTKDVANTKGWYLIKMYMRSDKEEDDYTEYFSTLEEKIVDLATTAEKDSIDDFDTYYGMARAFFKYANIISAEKNVLEKYIDSGVDGALDDIGWLVTLNYDSGALGSLLYQYLYSYIELYNIYKDNGCLSQGDMDYSCINDIEDESKYEKITLLDDCFERLEDYVNGSFLDEFLQKTIEKEAEWGANV